MSNLNTNPLQIQKEHTTSVSPNKKKSTITPILIGIVVLVLIFGCAGICIVLGLLTQTFSEQHDGNGNSNTNNTVPHGPQYLTLSQLYVKPDDTNPDYWFDDGAEIPFSYSFSSEVMLKQRLLTYEDGYEIEIIAFGGYPELYNFSILTPTQWTRTRITTENYELTSPNGDSTIGVRLFPYGTSIYAEYTSCEDEVAKIYSAAGVEIESSMTKTTNVTVDDKNYERVEYVLEDDSYPTLYGLDQCYKDSHAVFLIYVVISEDDDTEYFEDRVLILDDFIWDEI